MGRAPCCDKTKVKRGPWSAEEDALLKCFIEAHGTGGNWIALPRKAGLNRCGKSCRLRWLNYLRPNIKHGGFTDEEDYIVCALFSAIGSRWSVIASKLPGRTDNDVKNYWNTKLKKKLIAGKVAGFEARSGCIQPVQLNPTMFTETKTKTEPIAYDYGNNSMASCNIINNIGESSTTWENRVPCQQTWDPHHQDSHLTISGQSELPPSSTSSHVGGCGVGDEAAEDDIDDFWLRLLVDQSSFFAGSSQISGRSHHEKMNGFDTVLDDLFPPSVC